MRVFLCILTKLIQKTKVKTYALRASQTYADLTQTNAELNH